MVSQISGWIFIYFLKMLQISKIFQRFYAIIFKFQGKSIQIFKHLKSPFTRFRSSRPEVFLRKGVLEICSKFTGEHPCQSVILIKLLCNFIEITVRHGCFPVNLLQIFRTSFLKNTRGWLVLHLFHVFIAYLCFYNACNFMICDLRSKGGMDQLTFLHEIIVIMLICYYQIQYVL